MTAIFILGKTASEATLSARLTASRLALPPTARVVALISPDAPEPKLQVQRNFDELFYLRNGSQSLAHFVQSNAKPRAKLQDLLAAKRLHSVRWSAAAQVTTLRRKHQSSGISVHGLLEELGLKQNEAPPQSGTTRRRASVKLFHGSQVRALTSGRALIPSLRDAWERGLRSTYTLDNGVPYSKEYAPPSLLLVDSWPNVQSDPEKPFRVAAFSGWVMASPESVQDIHQLVERTQNFLRRKLYERTQG